MELKSKLSLEDLINLAKKPLKRKDKKKDLDRFSSLKRFLISDNVNPGEEHIPAILFYDRYIKWCQTYNEKNKLTLNAFYKELKLHFTKVKFGKDMCYMADPTGFDLSVENKHRVTSEYIKNKSKGRIKKDVKKKSQEDEEN